MLWSLQGGVVISLAGLGLVAVSARFSATPGDAADVAPAIYALAVLALAIGVGFVLSAITAYVWSRRLGVIETPPAARDA